MLSSWALAFGLVLAVALVLLGAGHSAAVADQSGARVFLPVGSSRDGLPAGGGTPVPSPSAPPSPTRSPSETATAVPPTPTATAAPLAASVPAGSQMVLQNSNGDLMVHFPAGFV